MARARGFERDRYPRGTEWRHRRVSRPNGSGSRTCGVDPTEGETLGRGHEQGRNYEPLNPVDASPEFWSSLSRRGDMPAPRGKRDVIERTSVEPLGRIVDGLFALTAATNDSVFQRALERWCDGSMDTRTLALVDGGMPTCQASRTSGNGGRGGLPPASCSSSSAARARPSTASISQPVSRPSGSAPAAPQHLPSNCQ